MNAVTTAEPRSRQEELGQFLTAEPVAAFMASLFGPLTRTVRLLDAGAGAGALTSAFVSRCCDSETDVRAIEATLYEFDPEILDALSGTLRDCERRCARAGIRFTFTIHSTVVDQYFRRFSGHTQVNATDLRTLSYPDRETLCAMGGEMQILDQSQEEIDQLVTKHLHTFTALAA